MPADSKAGMLDALRWAADHLRRFASRIPASPPPIQVSSTARPRLGLALGGGFARGMAHIGVLKVLVENGIPVDAVAGASAGSIVGALFAGGCPPDQMIEDARRIRWSSFARWTFPHLGFATNERMVRMLKRMLPCAQFEELRLPLAVVATDIATGEVVTFRSGPLVPPLRASCTVPGLFEPVEYQGRMLVDGAIAEPIPASALRQLGADKIVAVSLKVGQPCHRPANMFQVVGQAFQIAESRTQPLWRRACDLIIEPDVTQFKWDDFGQVDALVRAGEAAARRVLPELRALIAPAPIAAPGRPASNPYEASEVKGIMAG